MMFYVMVNIKNNYNQWCCYQTRENTTKM